MNFDDPDHLKYALPDFLDHARALRAWHTLHLWESYGSLRKASGAVGVSPAALSKTVSDGTRPDSSTRKGLEAAGVATIYDTIYKKTAQKG